MQQIMTSGTANRLEATLVFAAYSAAQPKPWGQHDQSDTP
jgi:hypothetical protein